MIYFMCVCCLDMLHVCALRKIHKPPILKLVADYAFFLLGVVINSFCCRISIKSFAAVLDYMLTCYIVHV